MLVLVGLIAGLLTQTPPPHPPPRDTLHILAVGDINLGRKLAKDYLEKGDTLYPFREVLDTFATADLLFGNLESPIAPDAHAVESQGIKFTAPPSRPPHSRGPASPSSRPRTTTRGTAVRAAWRRP